MGIVWLYHTAPQYENSSTVAAICDSLFFSWTKQSGQASDFSSITEFMLGGRNAMFFSLMVEINISYVFVHRVYMRLQRDNICSMRYLRALSLPAGCGGREMWPMPTWIPLFSKLPGWDHWDHCAPCSHCPMTLWLVFIFGVCCRKLYGRVALRIVVNWVHRALCAFLGPMRLQVSVIDCLDFWE